MVGDEAVGGNSVFSQEMITNKHTSFDLNRR